MKRYIIVLTAIASAFLIATPAFAATARNGVVFKSIPNVLPGNVSSVAFQATQASEVGDGIKFMASGKKHLKTVAVVMSSWACETGANDTCVTTPGATFTHPIRLSLYTTNVGNTPGSLIASVTKPFAIKYRPTSDTGANCGGDNTAWYSAVDSACYHGIAQTITFNFASLHLILPNSIVYGVALNTSGYGDTPYGYSTPCAIAGNCAYDSLNVSAAAGIPARGTDRYLSGIFYDSAAPGGQYCDSGAAGAGFFRLDDGCWAGFNPLVRFQFQK
jgi:hypothetical protein